MIRETNRPAGFTRGFVAMPVAREKRSVLPLSDACSPAEVPALVGLPLRRPAHCPPATHPTRVPSREMLFVPVALLTSL